MGRGAGRPGEAEMRASTALKAVLEAEISVMRARRERWAERREEVRAPIWDCGEGGRGGFFGMVGWGGEFGGMDDVWGFARTDVRYGRNMLFCNLWWRNFI